MLSESIAKLVQYGITTGLTSECERNYTTNLLRDVLIIRQGRTTGLFRSRSMILLGDSSILRMCITMSIVLYLTASILQ